jgi:hypothetical protein
MRRDTTLIPCELPIECFKDRRSDVVMEKRAYSFPEKARYFDTRVLKDIGLFGRNTRPLKL